LFDELSADWASNPEVMVEVRKALCAESVAAVDQNSWDLLSNIEFLPAVAAKVETSGLIISLD